MEIPTSNNPIADKTGANCAQQQSGPVWSAGSNGAPIVRDCVIPSGKALFFGPLNSECSYAEDSTLKTEDQLRSCAVNADAGGVPHVTFDGAALKSLDNYKIQSPIFNFTFPQIQSTILRKNWIIVASRDRVLNGVREGIAQADHGKQTLRRTKKDDNIIYYSPKMTECQRFTAVGKIKDNDIFHVKLNETFSPFRKSRIFS